jgi:hypothetical protein
MANLTVAVPDAAVPRIRQALQSALGLDHLPTDAEIQTYLCSHVRDLVVTYERLQLQQAVAPTAEANVATDFPAG